MTATTKRIKPRGILLPDALYTSEGAMRYGGIGQNSLDAAVESGIVVPVKQGYRNWYEGRQLIEWILSHGKNRH